MLYKIAIVEDEQKVASEMGGLLKTYGIRSNAELRCIWFSNAEKLLSGYPADYDIIFFDIRLPGMNGMEAAEKIRKLDNKAIIIFVTNMRQYAIKGYCVNALDFIVKPVEKLAFDTLLDKAFRILKAREEQDTVVIRTAAGFHRINLSNLWYIDIQKHKLTFHMPEGNVETWGILSNIEKKLPAGKFYKINSCYVINLQHIVSIEGDSVVVGTDELKIARTRKRSFIEFYTSYIGELGGFNV